MASVLDRYTLPTFQKEVASNGSRGISTTAGIIQDFRTMAKDKADEAKKADNLAKVNLYVQEYNNPQSQMFAGMEGSQRALKLSRLLYPHDPEMAQRYETQARNEVESNQEQVRSLERIGANDDREITDRVEYVRVTTQLGRDYEERSKPIFKQLPKDEQDKINARIEIGERRKAELESKKNGTVPTTPTIASVSQTNEPKEIITNEQERNLIQSTARDIYKDGVLDNEPELATIVNAFRDKHGLGMYDPMVKDLESVIDAIKESMKGARAKDKDVEDAGFKRQQLSMQKQRQEKEDKERDEKRALDKEKQLSEKASLVQIHERLDKDPNSLSAKSAFLLSLLRSESGAAIATSEFGQKVKALIGDSSYNEMVRELTGIGAIASGYIKPYDPDIRYQSIVDKYTAKIKANDIMPMLEDKIGRSVLEYKKSVTKPQKKRTLADLKRERGMK